MSPAETIALIRESTSRALTLPHLTDAELARTLRAKVASGIEAYTEKSDLIDEAIYRLSRRSFSGTVRQD